MTVEELKCYNGFKDFLEKRMLIYKKALESFKEKEEQLTPEDAFYCNLLEKVKEKHEDRIKLLRECLWAYEYIVEGKYKEHTANDKAISESFIAPEGK